MGLETIIKIIKKTIKIALIALISLIWVGTVFRGSKEGEKYFTIQRISKEQPATLQESYSYIPEYFSLGNTVGHWKNIKDTQVELRTFLGSIWILIWPVVVIIILCLSFKGKGNVFASAMNAINGLPDVKTRIITDDEPKQDLS